MTVSPRNFPTLSDARSSATVDVVPSVFLAEGAPAISNYRAEMVGAAGSLMTSANLLQAGSRASVHFVPPVIDSPALFERPIRESYGRYAHPHSRSFNAHA